MSQEYPSDWNTRRKEVYKRDNYNCQNCGTSGGSKGDAELHAHHIVPKSKGGTHKKSNLKTICKECHNAIHGKKMAPSVDTEPTRNELEFPLDIDRFPYSVKDQIQCGNISIDIYDELTSLLETFAELSKYSRMYSSLDADVPERLESSYLESKKDTDDQLKRSSNKRLALQDIDDSDFKEETAKYRSAIVETSGTLIDDIKVLCNRIQKIAHDDNLSNVDYYENHILNEDIQKSLDRFCDLVESLLESIVGEIEDEIHRLDRVAINNLHHSMLERCPICNEINYIRTFDPIGGSTNRIEGGSSVIRCRECHTDWFGKKDRFGIPELKVVSSDYDIEGYQMAPEIWNRVPEKNIINHKNIEAYEQLSGDLTYKIKRQDALISSLFIIVLAITIVTAFLFTRWSLFLLGVILLFILVGARHLLQKIRKDAVIENTDISLE